MGVLISGRCIFCGRCEEVCPTAANQNCRKEYELAVWKKEDFLQQSPLRAVVTAASAIVLSPFRKRIDYAIALLKHNGDSRAENHRESFETCPECKRQEMPGAVRPY